MTQDKSEEYLSTAAQAFPFTIISALIIGFMAYAINPQLGERILLSIPFILIGYGAFVLPILDLAGMHKLNAIGVTIYALLTTLYTTIITLMLAFHHVQWVVLYTALGMVSVIVASGCAYILLSTSSQAN